MCNGKLFLFLGNFPLLASSFSLTINFCTISDHFDPPHNDPNHPRPAVHSLSLPEASLLCFCAEEVINKYLYQVEA
jgi:hypothetical protein